MKSFSGWLLLTTLVFALSAPGVAQTVDSALQPQDFLLIEMLLSMQGAVIGGGLGVFGVGQFFESGWFGLGACSLESLGCQLVQSFQSLCLGSAIGIPFGATFFGIGLAEWLLDLHGNIWAALLGSMLGELIGVPQCSLISFLQDLGFSIAFNTPVGSDLSLLMNPIVLSAFGATVGYNLDLVFGENPAPSGWTLTLPLINWNF